MKLKALVIAAAMLTASPALAESWTLSVLIWNGLNASTINKLRQEAEKKTEKAENKYAQTDDQGRFLRSAYRGYRNDLAVTMQLGEYSSEAACKQTAANFTEAMNNSEARYFQHTALCFVKAQ